METREYNFLRRLFSVLVEEVAHPMNASQLAKKIQVNRRVVAGIIDVLASLGIVEFVYKQKNNELFRIKLPPDRHVTMDRLVDLVNLPRPAISPEDWVKMVDLLVPLVLSPDQMQRYLTVYEEEGVSILMKRLYHDFCDEKWGAALPERVRPYFIDALGELLNYTNFPVDSLLTNLRRHLSR